MVSHLKCDLLFVSNCLIIIRILGGRESVCPNGMPVFPAFMELTAVGIMTPAVFVIGSCPLTQHYTNGNPIRFRCACSVYTEKPEETNGAPTIKKKGSKACRHGIMRGSPLTLSQTVREGNIFIGFRLFPAYFLFINRADDAASGG